MPDDYSLADLARLADVTPRTIRYYVAQGLLPSPDAAGPSTRYSEGHLARLRIIRRMQRDHLPLAEIREQLERLTDEEVVEAAAHLNAGPTVSMARSVAEETSSYITHLMEAAHVEPRVHPAPGSVNALSLEASLEVEPGTARFRRAAISNSPLPPPSAPPPASLPLHERPPALRRAYMDDRSPSIGSRSTWERLVITPDVEIHVRRPLKPVDNKRIDILERRARELFQEEP